MKKEILKMAHVRSEEAFYRKYPTEAAFMKEHSKEFKKALRGTAIKKAQQGANQSAYNQQNAGMNAMAAGESEVQDAIANLSTGTPKKTVGQDIESVTNDIPVVGGLVKDVVGIFDASNEAKQQKRAGALSDLQVKAAMSQPRPQNRKYNRPDLDANVDDVNSLTPAQGTGTNLLGRNGIILSRGGEITNTYAPNDIYTNGGYSPLSDEDRMKAYYYGGHIPKSDAGSIISSVLGSSGGSGGGGGILGGLLGGGGGSTTTDTTTQDPANRVIRYVQAQDGTTTTGISTTSFGNTWIGKVLQGQNVNSSLIKNPTVANNVSQIGQTLQTGVSAIPGGDNKMSSSIKGLGNTVGSAIPLPGASEALGIAGSLIGDTITNNMGGTKAMARVQRNNDRLSAISASKLMQSNQNKYMRTGGNLRQNYSPDMERSGELTPLWGGHAEPISYNPYSPNGGETVMFRGKSHEESAGNGRTGIGVRYGEGAPLQSYQDGGNTNANVEVERGEPAMQMPDNTGTSNLVVFGNLPIPNQFISQLGDPNAKGKKFKSYVADLSKQEDKQNKLIKNTSSQLQDLDPKTPFDKLKFNSLSLALNGANDKLKDLAQKKQNTAHLQQAINDTAEEQGIDADALAKGKIQTAKKGTKVSKAQLGKNVKTDPELDEGETYEGLRSSENKLTTDLDNMRRTDPRQYEPKGSDRYNQYKNEFLDKQTDLNSLRDKIIRVGRRQDADKEDYTNDTYGGVPGSQTVANDLNRVRDFFNIVPRSEAAVNINSRRGPIVLGRNNSVSNNSGIGFPIGEGNGYVPSDGSTVSNPTVVSIPNRQSYAAAPSDAQSKKASIEQSMNLRTIPDVSVANIDQTDPMQYQSVIPMQSPSESWIHDKQVGSSYAPIMPIDSSDWNNTHMSKLDSQSAKKQIPQYFNPIGNYLPSNKEQLDPRQLTGEYYALSTNDLEPVPAQQYHPNLLTPYEISMQDILNENTAATRGAQKYMGYNPAAQSNLMAQQYGANEKVLGDQFRINQEEKDKVYGQNVNTLNDAQLKNLGILDQQYTRQAQALSNTKRTAQDALSSISDKYLQNKLQNDTNAIYQNMYNYRYDRNGHAWNMNGPANFNMQGNGNNQSSGMDELTPDEQQIAIYQNRIDDLKKKKTKEQSRNGSILKAMRNI
jgi:hypothetical protein